jgi:hypothetical protein
MERKSCSSRLTLLGGVRRELLRDLFVALAEIGDAPVTRTCGSLPRGTYSESDLKSSPNTVTDNSLQESRLSLGLLSFFSA